MFIYLVQTQGKSFSTRPSLPKKKIGCTLILLNCFSNFGSFSDEGLSRKKRRQSKVKYGGEQADGCVSLLSELIASK